MFSNNQMTPEAFVRLLNDGAVREICARSAAYETLPLTFNKSNGVRLDVMEGHDAEVQGEYLRIGVWLFRNALDDGLAGAILDEKHVAVNQKVTHFVKVAVLVPLLDITSYVKAGAGPKRFVNVSLYQCLRSRRQLTANAIDRRILGGVI